MRLRATLKNAGSVGGLLVILAFIAFLLIIPPFLTLGAVNTIFDTEIAMTFWRWVSLVWLHIVVASSAGGSKS